MAWSQNQSSKQYKKGGVGGGEKEKLWKKGGNHYTEEVVIKLGVCSSSSNLVRLIYHAYTYMR